MLQTAGNPIITSIYTADPSAHVWNDGRIYIYASHDIDPARGCDLMDSYHVFSSDDMVNWTDHSEILRASQVPWGRKEGGFMWAPDCAYKNGMYYFYFPHPSGTDWNTTWKIGIAISDKPAAGFAVMGYIPGLESMIDPCVFVDDGQAYFYYGGGGVCKGGKLKENMVELDGEMQLMEGLVDFHEATWVHKRNDIYYLSYSDNNDDGTTHNRMRYAVSSNPLGPWDHKGIYIEPTDSYTNHGSIVEYKGQWYAFYHDSAVSGHDWMRSVCVDRLYYNDDGTIRKVDLTEAGVPSVGQAPTGKKPLEKIQAEAAILGGGAVADIDSAASGGICIRNLQAENSFCRFDKVDGGPGGMKTIHVYYSANERGAKLNLTVNGMDHSFINAVSTGGSSNYNGHAYLTVPFDAGNTNCIKLTGGNGDVKIDHIAVSSL